MATGSRRLVIHFDVNETILVGDPAGGDTYEESLNKILCKNAFVRPRDATKDPPGPGERWTEYRWHDFSPLDPNFRSKGAEFPPLHTAWDWPEGCVPFYRVPDLKAEFAKKFTLEHSPGHIYRSLYDQLDRELQLPEGMAPIDPRLSHDQKHHYLIPAFYQTIKTLADQGRDFTVVLRSFGTDLPYVSKALTAWSEGKHPMVEGVPDFAFDPNHLYTGRFDEHGTFLLSHDPKLRTEAQEEARDAHTELGSLDLIESGSIRSMAIADHYEWWNSHGYDPKAGKPLWITLGSDHPCQHIFFDDNIHNDPDDSIVSIRVRDEASHTGFQPLTGEGVRQLQGTVLVRVPVLEAILNPNWFCEQVERCEERFIREHDLIEKICTQQAHSS